MFQVDVDYLKKAKKRREYAPTVISIVLAFAGVISALPIVYLFVTAFKPAEELFLYPPRFYVSNPTLKNFSDLVSITANTMVPFTRYLFNTIIITALYMFALIVVGTMACYPLSKHKFPGGTALFKLVTNALLIISGAAAIPSYIIVTGLHLDNTYLVYIIPGLANCTCMFLLKQFLDQVPNTIFEAGKIDGASEWQLYTKIALPLLRNAQATCVILTFPGIWGDAGTSTTYIYDEQLRTFAFFMSTLQGGLARTGANSAASLIMTLPSIIVFVISQSSVMDTMAHSGIK
ncbi:MAG: carbohydrate ABC transporter permease [Clostridia bacterium]|nr:carbohydrate ABC transporter permease [Clostridia bacterium]MBO7397832.1 carbohydrate ABC transporter permease [Clostridia bacterium]MBO7502864.1 carbohydrate ABC transporter permease [Clostridia bacterium]MBO7658266.1 carbohydrate ABC transporter permease [Clostridia bacterium]MBP5666298.1 carbohydrate ABC transporter permease [Clostridia bacterium]